MLIRGRNGSGKRWRRRRKRSEGIRPKKDKAKNNIQLRETHRGGLARSQPVKKEVMNQISAFNRLLSKLMGQRIKKIRWMHNFLRNQTRLSNQLDQLRRRNYQ